MGNEVIEKVKNEGKQPVKLRLLFKIQIQIDKPIGEMEENKENGEGDSREQIHLGWPNFAPPVPAFIRFLAGQGKMDGLLRQIKTQTLTIGARHLHSRSDTLPRASHVLGRKAEQGDGLFGATILEKNGKLRANYGEHTEVIKMAEHFREGGVVHLNLFGGGKLFSGGGGFALGAGFIRTVPSSNS